jgi:PAS domain-containing protein
MQRPDPKPLGESEVRLKALELVPHRVVLFYAIIGSIWILTTDLLLGTIFGVDGQTPVFAQVAKGWVFIFGTAVFLYIIVVYLTRRITGASHALIAAEHQFRDFAKSASDWFWETDSHLNLSYLSPRFPDITGLSPIDQQGRHISELFGGSVLASGGAELDSALARHTAFRDVFIQHSGSSHGDRFFRISGRPYTDASGAFLGYRGWAAMSPIKSRHSRPGTG